MSLPNIHSSAVTSIFPGENDLTNSVEPINLISHGPSSELSNDYKTDSQIRTSMQTQVASTVTELTTLRADLVSEIYSVPMYIGQYTFATTDLPGAGVAIGANVPFANANVARLFRDFRYASFDIRWTINVTGNPFASGIFIAASRPYDAPVPGGYLVTTGLSGAPNSRVNAIISLDHVVVDMSIDGVYTIDTPWSHFKSMMSFQDYTSYSQTYAYLTTALLCPYLPASGSTSTFNYEVYATLINVRTLEVAPYNAQSLFSFGEQHNVAYNLNNLRDATLPSTVIGDSVSATASIPFGLDNPSDTRQAPSTLRTLYQKFFGTKNVIDATRCATDSSALVTVSKKMMRDLRIERDEMSIEFFRNRWVFGLGTVLPGGALAYTFPFTPLNTTGQVLFSEVVSACDISIGASYVSTLDNIASQYLYWRGSIKYRFIIASNSYKRGKLLIAFNYGSYQNVATNITTGVQDPRSTHHIIVDVSSTDHFVDVEIPYKAVDEMKRTTSVGLAGLLGPGAPAEYHIGNIAVYCVSPLQSSNGTPALVNIVVLKAWGDDMQLFGRHSQGRLTSQSLLTPGSMMTSPETRLHTLSCFTSLKELLLRPVPYGVYTLKGSEAPLAAATVIPLMVPFHPTIIAARSSEWSLFYSSYAGCVGSYRAVIRMSNTPHTIKCTYVPFLLYQAATAIPGSYVESLFVAGNESNFFASTPNPYTDINISAIQGNQTNEPIFESSSGMVTVNSNFQSTDVYLDYQNQPEVVLDIPDPSPMYRTQPVTPVPVNYDFNSTSLSVYSPCSDRNVPWLIFQPVTQIVAAGQAFATDVTITLSIMAGDDLRGFWYKGGPTSTTAAASTYNTTVYPDTRATR